MFGLLAVGGVLGPPSVLSSNGARVAATRVDSSPDGAEMELRERVLIRLLATAEKERLRELLRLYLMDTDWPDAMKAQARQVESF